MESVPSFITAVCSRSLPPLRHLSDNSSVISQPLFPHPIYSRVLASVYSSLMSNNTTIPGDAKEGVEVGIGGIFFLVLLCLCCACLGVWAEDSERRKKKREEEQRIATAVEQRVGRLASSGARQRQDTDEQMTELIVQKVVDRLQRQQKAVEGGQSNAGRQCAGSSMEAVVRE